MRAAAGAALLNQCGRPGSCRVHTQVPGTRAPELPSPAAACAPPSAQAPAGQPSARAAVSCRAASGRGAPGCMCAPEAGTCTLDPVPQRITRRREPPPTHPAAIPDGTRPHVAFVQWPLPARRKGRLARCACRGPRPARQRHGRRGLPPEYFFDHNLVFVWQRLDYYRQTASHLYFHRHFSHIQAVLIQVVHHAFNPLEGLKNPHGCYCIELFDLLFKKLGVTSLPIERHSPKTSRRTASSASSAES